MEHLSCQVWSSVTPRRGAALAALLFTVVAILLSVIRPLWVDEILQLMETRQPSPTRMIVNLRRTPGAVPLGYLVQQAGLQTTGYSVVRARLTPALFGGASIYIVILLAAEVGLWRPCLAGAIFAAFPLTLRYATESRVYSQALFFSVLATFLHVRLTKRPSWPPAAACCLALSAAVYTQPYAGFVGVAHVLGSALIRNWRSALLSTANLLVAAITFLPWFLWSRDAWQDSIVRSAIHSHFSAATPLMVFRESIGAGYWGAGALVLLCGLAVRKHLPIERSASVLIVIPSTVLMCAMAADARFNYFIAARQFLWILPSLAILAAAAIERNERTPLALAALLGVFCLWQSALFFLYPAENWQAAADALLDEVHRGARLVVVPSDQAPLYDFFHPELGRAPATSFRIVMAVTPNATTTQRRTAVAAFLASGYAVDHEDTIGGSSIIRLHKSERWR